MSADIENAIVAGYAALTSIFGLACCPLVKHPALCGLRSTSSNVFGQSRHIALRQTANTSCHWLKFGLRSTVIAVGRPDWSGENPKDRVWPTSPRSQRLPTLLGGIGLCGPAFPLPSSLRRLRPQLHG